MRIKCSVGGSAIAKIPRPAADRPAPQLIPVMITAEQDAVAAQPPAVAEQIEIDVTSKYRVRVGSGFDGQAPCRVLDVLERR